MFELLDRDGLGRICRLMLPHGNVETPALLPVLNPNRPLFSASELRERFGCQILITNAYIIWTTPSLRTVGEEQGVHRLLADSGPIMTDSGTFQSHTYGEVPVGPAEILAFQETLRPDLATILDIFAEPSAILTEATAAVDETLKRARAAAQSRGTQLLVGPVQGGLHAELRERCARELSGLDFAVHAIGGVVPLMEQYRFADLVEVLMASKRGLAPGRPVHLFGAGHPMLFPLAVLLGCDLFDSASYAKFAQDGRMLFTDGTRALADLEELGCECPICSAQTAAALRALPTEERERALAAHNLYVSQAELRRTKTAIREGRLWELVELRARSHPELLAALRRLERHQEYLERFEPVSRPSAFFYTGPEAYARPIVARWQRRYFERYQPPPAAATVVFPDGRRPYGMTYRAEVDAISQRCAARFLVASFFGPVPLELDELYPIAQSVAPTEPDPAVRERLAEVMAEAGRRLPDGLNILWDGPVTLEHLSTLLAGEKAARPDWDRLRIAALLDHQFGRGTQRLLEGRAFAVKKSKTTGKIRTIWLDGVHAFSLRASDGRLTLRQAGARLLYALWPPPLLRVVVHEDAIPFLREGKNLFARFALEADPELRPGDEVLLTSAKDELVAFGQLRLSREELLSFQRGVVVKVREGFSG